MPLSIFWDRGGGGPVLNGRTFFNGFPKSFDCFYIFFSYLIREAAKKGSFTSGRANKLLINPPPPPLLQLSGHRDLESEVHIYQFNIKVSIHTQKQKDTQTENYDMTINHLGKLQHSLCTVTMLFIR